MSTSVQRLIATALIPCMLLGSLPLTAQAALETARGDRASAQASLAKAEAAFTKARKAAEAGGATPHP